MKSNIHSKNIIVILFLVFSVQSWTQENKLITSIPFEIDDYHQIYISVKVNNTDSLKFNIDTGASSIIIVDSIAKNLLNLNFDGRDINVGGSSRSEVLSSSNNKLLIGNIQLDNQTLYSIPYQNAGFDGIIGCEFFMKYVVSINYDSKMIYVYDKKGYRNKKDRIKFDVIIDNGVPLIEVGYKLNDNIIKDWFMLDTGAEDSFSFNSPAVNKMNLETKLVKIGSRLSTDSNGNKTKSTVSLIEELVFGIYSIYNIKTGLSRLKTGSEASEKYAGAFGNALLCKFNIVYDLGNSSLYLKPKILD